VHIPHYITISANTLAEAQPLHKLDIADRANEADILGLRRSRTDQHHFVMLPASLDPRLD
jgi:hypothetical protein